MTQQVTGVVATKANEATERRTIVVPDPGPTDVVVRVRACGVCHTDLHYRNGGISDDFPFLLGHEAAGVVEEIGSALTAVAPRGFVVLAWRAPGGRCPPGLRRR